MGHLRDRRAGHRLRLGALAALLALAPGVASATAALDLYYERALMLAADARCELFSPPVATALAAATAQARGAALRAGSTEQSLEDVRRRAAARAATAACNSADLATAAGRVRQAFEGFSRLSRIDYPGEVADWRAVRAQPAAGLAAWGLSQDSRFGYDRMTFGIAVRAGWQPLLAVGRFGDSATPYAARLVMRDTTRAPQPYLDRGRADAGGRLPLSARTPPRAASLVFNAEARSPAGRDLAIDGQAGWAFRFPPAAAAALARLDPRESVMVEFVFAGPAGDEVRTAYVEVGDYAAGRAFLAMGR